MTVGCYSVLGHMYKPSQDTYHTQDSMLGWFTLHYITLNFLQLSYRRTICEDICNWELPDKPTNAKD